MILLLSPLEGCPNPSDDSVSRDVCHCMCVSVCVSLYVCHCPCTRHFTLIYLVLVKLSGFSLPGWLVLGRFSKLVGFKPVMSKWTKYSDISWLTTFAHEANSYLFLIQKTYYNIREWMAEPTDILCKDCFDLVLGLTQWCLGITLDGAPIMIWRVQDWISVGRVQGLVPTALLSLQPSQLI